jgi:hypothetical protein
MINFFRKIRKKLADDNERLKYMRYAIGEIVLVVIGILIALQINNWNEERKLVNVEIDILKGIKQNLLMDTLDLNHNIRRYKEMFTRDSIILIYVADKKPLDSLVEDKLSDLWRSNMTIMLHNSYFDEAKTKGLSIISNKSLRDSISRLYEFRYALVALLENESKQYDYLSIYEDLMSDYTYLNSEFDSAIDEKEYQSILNNKFFTKRLFEATYRIMSLYQFYEEAKKATMYIINQIDIELAMRE